jgi:hypothetical protein
MATPHVAGAVAFLHSVGSKKFAQLIASNPESAAREIKSVLLESVDPISSLKGITVTEGRLNLFKAADTISKY